MASTPMQAPHPSAPLGLALARTADFTYSFFPKCSKELWAPCDARDGLVLVEDTSFCVGRASFTNLAVCNPLSRRYVLLPLVPYELTVQQDRLADFEPKLAPIGADEEEISFRVVCTAHYKSKLIVFVFSSVIGQWCIAASTSLSSLGMVGPCLRSLIYSNYVRGCLYWEDHSRSKLLVLDTAIMEFSTIDILTGYHVQLRNQPGLTVNTSTIVDGTRGALEMLTLASDDSSNSFYVYHTTQQNKGESSNEWQLKNVMELPRQLLYFTTAPTEGFLFLEDLPDQRDDAHINFFSLKVKSFELEKVCTAKCHPYYVHSYFGFPPSLSKPTL